MTKKKGSTGESFWAQYSFVVDGGDGTGTSRETDPRCSDSFGAQIQAFDGPRTKIRYYF